MKLPKISYPGFIFSKIYESSARFIACLESSSIMSNIFKVPPWLNISSVRFRSILEILLAGETSFLTL